MTKKQRIKSILAQVSANGGEMELYSEGNPPILDPEYILLTMGDVTRFYGERDEFSMPWDDIDEDELDIIEELIEVA